jgi:hypothetical protein
MIPSLPRAGAISDPCAFPVFSEDDFAIELRTILNEKYEVLP